jgi:hypothetical protein
MHGAGGDLGKGPGGDSGRLSVCVWLAGAVAFLASTDWIIDHAHYIHPLDEQTAHAIASGESVSQRNRADFNRRRRLREFTDHRSARLFTRMLHLRRSRVLVSSRLFPSNLETDWARPLPGCEVLLLREMSSAYAVDLWREFGATGPRADLVQVFQKLGNFPLAIRTLAGRVGRVGYYARYRLTIRNGSSVRHHFHGQGTNQPTIGESMCLSSSRS